MSEEPESKPSPSQLRQEAADWFSVMRGPEADDHRAEFEKWLARGALHRRAYNSVSGNFALGKFLKEEPPLSEPSTTPTPERNVPRHSGTTKALAAATVCGLGVSALGLTWHALDRRTEQLLPPVSESAAATDVEARYATAVGEIRRFALPDGSKVILDTDSLIFASLTPRESDLRLMKGRARFFTSPGKHDLVVRADTAAVRGHDAVFDVALVTERHVIVHPIAGQVDVQHQAEPGPAAAILAGTGAPAIAHINAGSQLALEDGKPVSSPASAVQTGNWPDGVEQFDDVPLSVLVDDANRYANKPIRFGRADLAGLKISGTFHLANTKHVAQQVARLLDLRVAEDKNHYVLNGAVAGN